jgi:ubiquinone/menaquinone biosynthesis C-methylase UbiE
MRDDPRKHATFNGTVPETYDRFLGPLLFEPFAIDLAGKVGKLKPQNVLEVAAGTGIVTREMLKTLPRNSRLSVTDLNDPMIDYARNQVGEDSRVSWRQADAMELPFDDGEFDAVVCQFGIMFFPDKALGMREFYRVLAAGGTLLLSVWDSLDRNPPQATIRVALAEVFPEDPPDFYNVAFSMCDVNALRALAAAAGFSNVKIETLLLEGRSPSAGDAATGLVGGNPVINAIRERAPELVSTIEKRTRERLADRFGTGEIKVPLRAHVLTASK